MKTEIKTFHSNDINALLNEMREWIKSFDDDIHITSHSVTLEGQGWWFIIVFYETGYLE